MNRPKLRRPSPAMCVAMIALGISLNGTAFGRKSANSTVKLPANSITSKMIKKGAVQRSDIARGAVTSAALGKGAVTATAIADDSVTEPAIANDAVTAPAVATGAITSDAIANGSISGPDVETGAIGTGALAKGAVTYDNIAKQSLGADLFPADGIDANLMLTHGSIKSGLIDVGAVEPIHMNSSSPAASVFHSSSQAMPGLSASPGGAPVQFSGEEFDTGNVHTHPTNNHRLTAPIDGLYTVVASVVWDPDPDGFRALNLLRNGVIVRQLMAQPTKDSDGAALPTQQAITHRIELKRDDYIELRAFQVSAPCTGGPPPACFTSTLNIKPDPSFSMVWDQPLG